jgi:chemotaxis signal transduction protein
LRPRTLVDVSSRSQETVLFGREQKMPIAIAPTGFAGLLWYHGELELARGAPAAVRGLMNLRGQIVTVIDPAVRLGYPARELKKSTRLMILKTNADLASLGLANLATHDELAGLWVDRISDVITVTADQIAPAPPDQSGKNDHLLAAVVQLKDKVIRLVDPSALLGQDGVE